MAQQRITIKHLDIVAGWLNKATNNPPEPYAKDAQGKYKAQIGNFHISQAYGGYCLHQMNNNEGGVTTPLGQGHIPARELYEQMQAFLKGIQHAKEDGL